MRPRSSAERGIGIRPGGQCQRSEFDTRRAGALYRWGRIVLMGSSAAPIPLNYMQMMFNNLEMIGNFMHAQNAYLALLSVRPTRYQSDHAKSILTAVPSAGD
jgi:hypothetical protein